MSKATTPKPAREPEPLNPSWRSLTWALHRAGINLMPSTWLLRASRWRATPGLLLNRWATRHSDSCVRNAALDALKRRGLFKVHDPANPTLRIRAARQLAKAHPSSLALRAADSRHTPAWMLRRLAGSRSVETSDAACRNLERRLDRMEG